MATPWPPADFRLTAEKDEHPKETGENVMPKSQEVQRSALPVSILQ